MSRNDASRAIPRRTLLKAAGAGGMVAASSLAAPALAQVRRDIRLVTAWPGDFPILSASAERLARRLTTMSGSTLSVQVFPASTLVEPFASFDAVARGDAEIYHAIEYYWQGKSTAFSFFASVPFGLTPSEMDAWIYHGGGQILWDELSAQFGLKPFLAGNLGLHMAGWFSKPIRSVDDLIGLRIAAAGLAAGVLRRVGAAPITLAGRDVLPALRNGSIAAAQWFGPWMSMEMGFPGAARFYAYPGYQEPGTAVSCAVNLEFWNSLTLGQQHVVSAAMAEENALVSAEFRDRNAEAIERLLVDERVEAFELPEKVLLALGAAAGEVVAEAGTGDAIASRIHDAFLAFRRRAVRWSKLSDRAYLDARLLPFPYGK